MISSNVNLGVQTNPDNVFRKAHWMAHCWAPSWAKSYSIRDLCHTDYYGMPMNAPTGYADIKVTYYSTVRNGRFRIAYSRTDIVSMLLWDATFPILATYQKTPLIGVTL